MWSSAGVTAGIDLTLALVEHDHSTRIAQTIAQHLVMFLRRPGGQSQFAAPTWIRQAPPGPIRRAQEIVIDDPGADHRVGELARHVGMSERHFVRSFSREVGVPPARFVARIRVDSARQALESSTDTVDSIARRCGFGTAETMRRTLVRHIGVSPDDYRRRFRHQPRKQTAMTEIVIPLFPNFTALDAIGPYEVLQRIPDFDITFIGHERGVVRSDNSMLGIEIDGTFEDHPRPDVIVFPGGVGTRAADARRASTRLGPEGARDHHVHHLGVHRFARARRGRACSTA